jgi:hypothetical protein
MGSGLKSYTLYLYPNNQPPIFLGRISARNKKEAIKLIIEKNGLKKEDSKYMNCLYVNY